MTKTPAPSIQIEGQTHLLSDLSKGALKQVQNLTIVDAEIKRLRTQLAIAQTAQRAYALALKTEMAQGAGKAQS